MNQVDRECLERIGTAITGQQFSSFVYRDIYSEVFHSGTKNPHLLEAGDIARVCWGRGEHGDQFLPPITACIERVSEVPPEPAEAVSYFVEEQETDE